MNVKFNDAIYLSGEYVDVGDGWIPGSREVRMFR